MEKVLSQKPQEDFTKPEISSSNPILLGQLPPGDPPHSILHYIDRSNPTGPAPQDPMKDPMYLFWEEGIRIWLTPPATPIQIQNPIF